MVCGKKVCSKPAAGGDDATSLGFAPSLGSGAEAVSLAVTPGTTPSLGLSLSLSPTVSPGARTSLADRRVAEFARRHRRKAGAGTTTTKKR